MGVLEIDPHVDHVHYSNHVLCYLRVTTNFFWSMRIPAVVDLFDLELTE